MDENRLDVSRWRIVRKFLVLIMVLALSICVVILIYEGYRLNWEWTGFVSARQNEKTLWDWMQLLIVPFVLVVGGYLFNLTISRNEQESTRLRDQTERDIANDNQREAALQAYIDKMSELLLEKHLRESPPEDEVRKIARVRSLTVLSRLDAVRKRSLLQFLYESGLIDKDEPIVDLEGADLIRAAFSGINLSGANLLTIRVRG